MAGMIGGYLFVYWCPIAGDCVDDCLRQEIGVFDRDETIK